jgi:hypothetical protein
VGDDQGKNYRVTRRQSATFSEPAHAGRGFQIINSEEPTEAHDHAVERVILDNHSHYRSGTPGKAKLPAGENNGSDEALKLQSTDSVPNKISHAYRP